MSLLTRARQEAATWKPAQSIKTVIVLPFFVPGWILGRGARLVWDFITLLVAAFTLGIKDGWAGPGTSK